MKLRNLLCGFLVWWFLFYQGADGRWIRYGPFNERHMCDKTAQNLVRAGITAKCVEFPF